ncbi:MAG: hypothetical protein ACUVTZ_05090 [Armatimonadota bacterium]
MLYAPYDWNENVRHRNEFVEARLREGSPVVGVSCQEGVLFLTLRGPQRKIFEVYDRLMFSGLGRQADIEAVRIAAIDVAHQEGYLRSPDDVTIQRIVGFAVSPFVRRIYNESLGTPLVIRAMFAEVGRNPEDDLFFCLSYDGEFESRTRTAAVAGTAAAEKRMLERLQTHHTPNLLSGIETSLWAWSIGQFCASSHEDDPTVSDDKLREVLARELKERAVEAAVLDRDTVRESRFRLLTDSELAPALAGFR